MAYCSCHGFPVADCQAIETLEELEKEFEALSKMPCPCGAYCPHDQRYEELKILIAQEKQLS